LARDIKVSRSKISPGPAAEKSVSQSFAKDQFQGWNTEPHVGVPNQQLHTSFGNYCHPYKARWEIELFFKWIKQNLRVKTFYGTSPNAVKIQIWIAMIVYLKLAILKERYHLEPSLSKLLHFLEVNLFERKSLINIFQTNTRATHKYEDIQLKLFNY